MVFLAKSSAICSVFNPESHLLAWEVAVSLWQPVSSSDMDIGCMHQHVSANLHFIQF